MQSNRRMTIVIVAVLTLVLTASSTAAGLPVGEGQTSGEIRLAGTVLSKITYQGRLTDAGGNPLEGTYNLVFQLWDDPSAGSQQGVDIPKNDVSVSNGLFTVELDVPQEAFNGQGLWLRISVNGQWLSPRQELLPVPYALSLRPGAIISSPGPHTLHAWNTSGGFGIEAWSQGNIGVVGSSGVPNGPPSGLHGVHGIGDGVGVYGEGGHTGVHGEGTTDGVRGESTDGRGVYGRSDGDNGVVGWTGASNRSGVFGNSQTGVGVTGRSEGNDGLLGVTASADSGDAGVRARNEGSGPAIFSEGDLFVTGAFEGDIGPNGGAPFPRPAYDSGWEPIAKGESLTLQHGVGGDVDNYVVDLQFKEPTWGVHEYGYGGDRWREEFAGSCWYDNRGAFWHLLSPQTIMVSRLDRDDYVQEVRVRIWVYR